MTTHTGVAQGAYLLGLLRVFAEHLVHGRYLAAGDVAVLVHGEARVGRPHPLRRPRGVVVPAAASAAVRPAEVGLVVLVGGLFGDASVEGAVVELRAGALFDEHVEHLRLRHELEQRADLGPRLVEEILPSERKRGLVCARTQQR